MRVRLRYAKLGKVRFTSHRDVARIWERALRKAELPVALTGGFSPRPRLSFGLALPTGAESVAELLDVELASGLDVDPDEIPARLTAVLPAGFEVTAVEVLGERGPSLQEDVVATRWELTLCGVDRGVVAAAVQRALAAPTLPLERERKGERSIDDVRPAIESIEVLDGEPVTLVAVLATGGRGLRPHELAAVLVPELDPLDVVSRVLRTHQWIDRDGARRELLPVGATAAAAPASAACA
jgi:radical SAM-linked protein